MIRLMLPLLAAAGALLTPPAAALDLAACRLKGIEREVRCGVIQMPEDPDRADGRRIPIHFAVVPALAKNRTDDPLFVFAGGPGQSARKAAGIVEPLFAQLNARRDVVYIDQRGTGGSNPLLCDAPNSAASIAAQLDMTAFSARMQRCLQRIRDGRIADLRQYATWIAVRDVDAVRAALGYERVNLWGASYGTRVALEYLRQYPQRVRSAVLDGVAPADMALPASFSIDADAMLRHLIERCSAEAACRSRYPHFAADVDALLARADRAAPKVEIADPLTGVRETVALDQRLVSAALRMPLYAPQLSSVLPHAVLMAAAGEYTPLITLAGALASNVAENFAEGMHYAVICAEDLPRMDRALRDAALRTRFGAAFAQTYDDVCRYVDVRAVPSQFYSIPEADVPVLILSGGADPATPPRHGEAVAKRLRQALHLVAPNLGHGVSLQGCAPELVTKFIRQAGFDGIDGACLAKLPAATFFQPPRAQQP
jgi:pimeloyl-ACP methyl ester carboxylesterase